MIAALILALNPLFIRLSLMTLSESLFIFWMLLGFLFFVKGRDLGFGIFMGLAAITRPEALGIFAVLMFLKWKQIRRPFVILAAFALIYSVNSVVLSIKLDRIVVLPKAGLMGTSAENWKRRETWVEFAEKEKVVEELKQNNESSILKNYTKRLPLEIGLLGRHIFPILGLLALFGIYRRRTYLLAAFVPFIFFPLFTPRSEPRFIFPYIPFLVLYGLIGLECIGQKRFTI